MKFECLETQIEANAKETLEKAIREKRPAGLWLDKHGEQVTVTFAPQHPDEGDVSVRLQEAMSVPSFPIAVAVRGRLFSNDGDPMSIDDLPEAIKAAEDERTRFYTEREKEFGPSAWPSGR
jgi:hypothetical protein